MDKLQTVVVILLVIAIVFSIASVAMNIYLANLKPVTAKAVNLQGTRGSSGGLEIGILPPAGGGRP